MNAGFQCGARSLHRTAFYDAIAGPTEFIISVVNSVKMVICPWHDTLKEGKSHGILFIIIIFVRFIYVINISSAINNL